MTPASKVGRNFSRGASSYDLAASFQDSVAERLASLLDSSPRYGGAGGSLEILELGCGTGLLTGRLLDRFPDSRILASDLSAQMLDVCEMKFPKAIEGGRMKLLEHDFNSPFPSNLGSFDLVVSSLALQWGADLKAVMAMVNAVLKPAGGLLLSMPLEGSLSGLSFAFDRAVSHFPGLPLLDEKSLREVLESSFPSVSIELNDYCDGRYDLHSCLRRLRDLGTVNAGHPIHVGELRRVLRTSSEASIALDYKVALCLCHA